MSDGLTEYFLEEARKRSPGLKFDMGKPPFELLDRYALEQIALVLKFGAQKYSPHNWRNGIQLTRLTGAALRHISAFNDGETLDDETNLSHLAHAGCCIMFALWLAEHRPEFDDRWHIKLAAATHKSLNQFDPTP